MNKFIFLDIDGVLNSNLYFTDKHQSQRYNECREKYPEDIAWGLCNIDSKAVSRLNRLIEATGAKIVISSSWRFDRKLQEIFTAAGVNTPIYSRTPFSNGKTRGFEIEAWLSEEKEPYTYVIFDDDSDMLESQLSNFIQSDWFEWGLSDEDVELAIHILNEQD